GAPVVHARGKDRRREKPEPIQAPIPQDKNQENDSETGLSPLTQANREDQAESSEVTQDKFIDRHARKPREHLKTWGARLRRRWFEVTGEELDLPLNLKECQHLHHDLLQADDEAFKENILQESDHNIDTFVKDVADYSFLKELGMIEETATEELAKYFEDMKKIASIEDHVPEGDIHFEEGPVGRDLERPHQNRSLMSKWEAKVPRRSNPAYAFNDMVEGAKKYKEIPYMPKLIALARQEMTRVFQTEFRRKEQIKSAIAVKCIYYKKEKNLPYIKISEKWHRGEMRAFLSENYIDEHLTSSGEKIDKKIEEYLENGSKWILVRIDITNIEVYTYNRATGRSYEPTSKKLANTKCTINPDNKGLIDSETNALSEKCLQGALGCYFANQDQPNTDHLERIFQATKLKPYLDVVKLDGIPIPTPICSRIFNKIEEMNPDISINVWEWKEETATPKPVIASKNIYIPNSCKIENCKHN
ncbi:hypothetical protein RclHR1_38810001, partial [Rhizophagus clarus]